MDLFVLYSCRIQDMEVRSGLIGFEYDAAQMRRAAESRFAIGKNNLVANNEVRLVSVV